MGRAPCCDKANVKRGPWSPEEDATLKNYLQKHGTGGNWISLPQRAGLKRCGKSCRLRWLNYLRPDIKHGAFTEEEDNTIISLYSKMGSRWSVIAANLPGRTDNDVKNHWNTKLKKRLFGGGGRSTNKSFNHSTTPKIKNVTFSNNIINPVFQGPASSSSPSPSPSFVDNRHNYSGNHHHHHHHHQFHVTIPSFSDLLAQCTSNAPMYYSLPSYNPFGSLDPPNYAHNNDNDGVLDLNDSASRYPLDQLVDPQSQTQTHLVSQCNSTLTPTGNIYYPPQKEVSSMTCTPIGSYNEDDTFLSELGFGLIQEVPINNTTTCDYDHQQEDDIKPKRLVQGLANY